MSDIRSKNFMDRLHRNASPFIGQASVKQITIPELLMLLRRIEERGESDESLVQSDITEHCSPNLP